MLFRIIAIGFALDRKVDPRSTLRCLELTQILVSGERGFRCMRGF
jgi:hypothetical protein